MKSKDWIYPEATEIDTKRDLQIVKKYLPKHGIILDAGGGLGRISIPLAKLGYKVVLFDISPTALRFAKIAAKKEDVEKKIDLVEGDVCNLRFKDNYFDMVLALRDVINYSLDASKAASELVRVLKKDCYLVASVSNKVFWVTKPESWGYEAEKIKSVLSTEKMLTEGELRKLFENKLRIEKVLGSGYCSGNLPSGALGEQWIEIENEVGDREDLKFACEYLVLIGRKYG